MKTNNLTATKVDRKSVTPQLEHVNVTVKNPEQIAQALQRMFNWEIRWAGLAKDSGYTIHVGDRKTGASYLALYTHEALDEGLLANGMRVANLNHVGIVVDNLEEIEQRILAEGFVPHSHGNYEPGRRLYFNISEEMEVEVISYT